MYFYKYIFIIIMKIINKYFTCIWCKKKETPEEKRKKSTEYIIESIENKVSELYTIKEEEEEDIIYDIIPDYFDGKKINKKLDDKVKKKYFNEMKKKNKLYERDEISEFSEWP